MNAYIRSNSSRQNADPAGDHQQKPRRAWCKRLTERFCSDYVDAKLDFPMASGEDGDLVRFSARWATRARSLAEAGTTSAV